MVDSGLDRQGMMVGVITVNINLNWLDVLEEKMLVEMTLIDTKKIMGDCLDYGQPFWIKLMFSRMASSTYKNYFNVNIYLYL